jgi:hypothetical protein
MKQLNWWRGLWRVWIVGTVAWAVWTFWKSDPQCLIYLVHATAPWEIPFRCVDPIDRNLEYYAWVLVSMFGWPSTDRYTSSCITLGYRRVL